MVNMDSAGVSARVAQCRENPHSMFPVINLFLFCAFLSFDCEVSDQRAPFSFSFSLSLPVTKHVLQVTLVTLQGPRPSHEHKRPPLTLVQVGMSLHLLTSTHFHHPVSTHAYQQPRGSRQKKGSVLFRQ